MKQQTLKNLDDKSIKIFNEFVTNTFPIFLKTANYGEDDKVAKAAFCSCFTLAVTSHFKLNNRDAVSVALSVATSVIATLANQSIDENPSEFSVASINEYIIGRIEDEVIPFFRNFNGKDFGAAQ